MKFQHNKDTIIVEKHMSQMKRLTLTGAAVEGKSHITLVLHLSNNERDIYEVQKPTSI